MLAPTSAADAGKRLRAARERLCLSIREVEDLSREIALKMNAPDFFISRTWLGALEAGKLKLNIYRLQSLSLIYRLGLDEILSFFGVDIARRWHRTKTRGTTAHLLGDADAWRRAEHTRGPAGTPRESRLREYQLGLADV